MDWPTCPAPTPRRWTRRRRRAFLAGKAAANIYEHLDEFLDIGLMQQLLRLFGEARAVGDVGARLTGGGERTALQVGQNVLWLYKHGFLEARDD